MVARLLLWCCLVVARCCYGVAMVLLVVGYYGVARCC